MNINLLELGDDILNIIGDYVKKDNIDYYKRKDEETKKMIFKYVTTELKEIKKICKDRLMIIKFIYLFFRNCSIRENHPYIEEYLKLKKFL